MFRWIRNLWQRRKMRRHRCIFHAFDGKRMRAYDPMALHLAFNSDPEWVWDLHGALVDAGEPDAMELAAATTSRILGIPRWDSVTGKGLTTSELVAILYEFDTFCESVKKKYSPGLTSLQPTEPAVSTPPVDPSKTTNSYAGCG